MLIVSDEIWSHPDKEQTCCVRWTVPATTLQATQALNRMDETKTMMQRPQA
jgi:hypothetical protein